MMANRYDLLVALKGGPLVAGDCFKDSGSSHFTIGRGKDPRGYPRGGWSLSLEEMRDRGEEGLSWLCEHDIVDFPDDYATWTAFLGNCLKPCWEE